MKRTIPRREFIAAMGAGLIAAPSIVRAAGEPVVIRAGALKLIHSIAPYFYDKFVPAGYKVEVMPFETPTECKSAVVTKSVDFGTFGIAAAILGAAAGEPVVVIASTCNRGMAIIAKKDSGITSLKDLKGKRVAMFPGTTQEVFFLERLRMEGMTIKDVEPVRVSFQRDAHLARARRHRRLCRRRARPRRVALERRRPARRISLSTPMGSLNMVFGTIADLIKEKPELVKVMLGIHQRATDYAQSNKDALVAMASQSSAEEGGDRGFRAQCGIDLEARRRRKSRNRRSTPSTCWR